MSIQLLIDGMKCQGCVNNVENALKQQAGVTHAQVDLASKTATIEGSADTESLIQSVTALGFKATLA